MKVRPLNQLLEKLKHGNDIHALGLLNCPAKSCHEKDCEGFRFCFDSLNHRDTWLTQAEKFKRTGTYPRAAGDDGKRCDDFGLSFFTTEEEARYYWKHATPKLRVRMRYTNIMKGKITTNDGICSEPVNNGHFNLFEYKTSKLQSRFLLVNNSLDG